MTGRQGRRRFGAIRRLASGRYQVRYRSADGRYVTAPTTFETKADAGRYLSKVEADLLRGEWADPRLGRTTFGEWADRWLDSTVNLRANTKAGYRTILRRYLRPAFQSYPLASIDVLVIRTWLAGLEAEGVGQATRAKAYRLLARILGAAVEARYLAVNPCSIRGAASDGTSEMQIATVEQVAAIADQVPPRYRALVLVAAFGGLRWGELAGLRRKRVDLGRPTQERRRPPDGHPAGRGGCRAGRAPGRLHRGVTGCLRVPEQPGQAPSAQQLQPPGLAARHPSGRRRGPACA